jgi:hypothetical protein
MRLGRGARELAVGHRPMAFRASVPRYSDRPPTDASDAGPRFSHASQVVLAARKSFTPLSSLIPISAPARAVAGLDEETKPSDIRLP